MILNLKDLDLIKSVKKDKPLPEGGVWRTIKGHKVYIKDGEILAGHIPGVTDTKEFKKLIPKTGKTGKAPDEKPADKKKAKKSGTEEMAEARKKVNEIASSRPKEPPKKTVKEAMVESKKATDEALKKPNPKSKPGKSATKEDLDKLAEEGRKNKKPAPKVSTPEEVKAMLGTSEAKKPKDKKPKDKKVADIRSEKQAGNQIAYDVGEKVGGARKDYAISGFKEKATGQSLNELEKIAPELAQKMCIKANILQPVDFEKEYKTGTAIEVAIAKKLIYDRIAPKPPADTSEARAQYLNAIRSLQRALEPIKSWDEFKEARKNLGHWMRNETQKSRDDYASAVKFAEQKLKEGPRDYELTDWHYDRATGKRVDTAITKEQWMERQRQRIQEMKNHVKESEEFAKSPYAPLGEKLTNFFTDSESANRTIDTINKKNPKWEDYFSKENTSEKKKPKESRNRIVWERIMPAKIQRSGGRKTAVAKPEDMLKAFNLRGVEFGNWVDDTSGKFHLIKCAEAFQDLADIIEIDDKDVSLNGRLAIAFGARGHGAAGEVAAVAHYEPSNKVINITKEGGAGSLAHEWGHALDNIMYQQSTGQASMNLASNGMGDKGDPAVKAAYDKVMGAILIGSGTGTDEVPNKHKTYYSYHSSFKQAVQLLGLQEAIKKGAEIINKKHSFDPDFYRRYGISEADIEKRRVKMERQKKLAMGEMVQEMAYHHEQLTGEKLDYIPMPNGRSKYYEDSAHAGGSVAYYTSSDEMFARAFENYIQGKMRSGKVKNDYLVYGTWVDGNNDSGILGVRAPYPCGKERDDIHAAFDELIAAIQKSGAIKKGLSFDLQKSLSHGEELNRCAYPVNWQDVEDFYVDVFYIPINRLKTDYQTSEALDFDKIKDIVGKVEQGVGMLPVVIGYDYDVHDGHHRIEASKILRLTHVPCVVRGNNALRVQQARESYRELWKSFNESDHPRDEAGRFTDKDGQDSGGKITEVYHLTRDKDFKYDPNYKNTKQEMGAGLYTTPMDDAMYWHRALQDKDGSRHRYAIPIDVSETKLIHAGEIPYGLHELAKHLIGHYGSADEALKHVDEEEAEISGEIFGNEPSFIAQRRLYAKTKGYDGIILHDDREGTQVLLFNGDHVKFKPAITADDLFDMKKQKDFPFLYVNTLQKSISRADAKNLHKDLPSGGVWRTIRGHHIYILNGTVIAGAIPGVTGPKKASKAQLKEHQANIDKEAKNRYTVGKEADVSKNKPDKKGAGVDGKTGKAGSSEGGQSGRKAGKDQGADNRADDKGRVQQGGSGSSGQSALVEYKKAKPEEFHKAIAAAKANNDHGAFVDLHDVEDYGKDKLLLSPSGGAGCAVEPNGNIVSAFKDPKSNESGAMHSILINALKNGGSKLDCYDGFLPKAYAQHGFVPVARLKFNREYASPDWNYERDGEPDVVFMAHNGDSVDDVKAKMGSYPMPDMSKVPYVEDYDAGIKARDSYMKSIKSTSEANTKSKKSVKEIKGTMEANVAGKRISLEEALKIPKEQRLTIREIRDRFKELGDRVPASEDEGGRMRYLPEAYTGDYMVRSANSNQLARYYAVMSDGSTQGLDSATLLSRPESYDALKKATKSFKDLAAFYKNIWNKASEDEKKAMINIPEVHELCTSIIKQTNPTKSVITLYQDPRGEMHRGLAIKTGDGWTTLGNLKLNRNQYWYEKAISELNKNGMPFTQNMLYTKLDPDIMVKQLGLKHLGNVRVSGASFVADLNRWEQYKEAK